MRARAKKKAASRQVAKTLTPRGQTPPPAATAARALPDPQRPPVVAPVLMPGVDEIIRKVESPPDTAGVPEAGADAQSLTAGETRPPHAAAPELTDAPADGEISQTIDQDAATEWRARDEARLLVQSPHRVFLYWRFRRAPRELLREALGPVAERFNPAVRLVDAASGEEGEPAAADGSDYWFDVSPGRLLRAEVGFHGEGLPFVRLLSSNTVETPAVGVSPAEDAEPEFRVGAGDFGRVLEATGFAAEERHAGLAQSGAPNRTDSHDQSFAPLPGGTAMRATSSPRDGAHFSGAHCGEVF